MTDDTDDVRTSTVTESAPKAEMGEFTHANPYTGRTFGEVAFDRGPTVAADGGERDEVPGTPSEPDGVSDADVDSVSDSDVDGVTDADVDDVTDVDPATEDGRQTMRDVDHEHPYAEADEANRVFRRGHDDEDV
jgi:hypothetical protein